MDTSQDQESINWQTYLNAGKKALGLSRYQDAEKLFQKALMDARREQSQSNLAQQAASAESDLLISLGLADISSNMGELYRLQGLFKEAESFFKQAIDLYEKSIGENTRPMAEALTRLGAVFRGQGKYSSQSR